MLENALARRDRHWFQSHYAPKLHAFPGPYLKDFVLEIATPKSIVAVMPPLIMKGEMSWVGLCLLSAFLTSEWKKLQLVSEDTVEEVVSQPSGCTVVLLSKRLLV